MSEGGKRRKSAAMLLNHSHNEKIIKYISSSQWLTGQVGIFFKSILEQYSVDKCTFKVVLLAVITSPLHPGSEETPL